MSCARLFALRGGAVHLLAVLLALALCRIGPASADDGKEVPTVCKELGKDKHAKAKHAKKTDDEDDDDDDDDEGVRFDLAGACAKLTCSASYSFQQAQKSASGM